MVVYIKNTPTNIDELPTVLYNNLMATGTVTASSSSTNYPVANLLTESTTEYWKPSSVTASVSLDCLVDKNANSLAIIGHTLGSTNSTVELRVSSDGITFSLLHSITPQDDSAIVLLFNDTSWRYWRITILGSTSLPYISNIFIGERFTFPAGVMPPYTPTWACKTYDLLTSTTIGGQFIGNRVIYTGGETSINLVAFSTEFATNNLESFRQHYNKGKAFVWAMSPSKYPKDVAYVWRKESSVMKPTFDNDGNWMSVGMEVYVYGD